MKTLFQIPWKRLRGSVDWGPLGIPKTIVIYIIYKYRGLGLGLGLGLGGVQKAKTRQIDASEIIGKAGSSEQEGPNHPKSPSKT